MRFAAVFVGLLVIGVFVVSWRAVGWVCGRPRRRRRKSWAARSSQFTPFTVRRSNINLARISNEASRTFFLSRFASNAAFIKSATIPSMTGRYTLPGASGHTEPAGLSERSLAKHMRCLKPVDALIH